MKSGKLLSIDHGIKRIGIAVSDMNWLLARELTVIKRKSKAEDFARISHMVDEQKAIALIIGIPTNYEAAPGTHTQADTVRLWIERLQEIIPLPVVLWDEQLSSEDAKMLARQQRRKSTLPIDDLAARVILQSYLDALRNGLADAPPIAEG